MLTYDVGTDESQAGNELRLIPPYPEQANEEVIDAGAASNAVLNAAIACDVTEFWSNLEPSEARAWFMSSNSAVDMLFVSSNKGQDVIFGWARVAVNVVKSIRKNILRFFIVFDVF